MTSDINGTVVAIQGVAVSSTSPTDGQVLTYDNADGYWRGQTPPSSLPPNGSAGGDLGGTYPNPTVISVAHVTTGTLPAANQAAQTMGGNVSGTTTSATVVALQGNAVKSGTPSDGQVLTWVNVDSKWEPQTPAGSSLNKASFTSSGTWTCPTGITNILVIAAGGGGGGGGGSGSSNYAGAGGGGSIQQTAYVSVTAGNNYTITIGAGGSGGSLVGSGTMNGHNGSDGSATTIVYSSTTLFSAIGGGGGSGGNTNSSVQLAISGTSFSGAVGTWFLNTINNGTYANLPALAAFGGWGSNNNAAPGSTGNGAQNYIGGYSAGTNPGAFGGGGGGAGPSGAGGNGGSGNTGGNANSGSNVSANTAAGGGGGGAAAGAGNSGAGGNGGSGYLYIIY